MTDTIESLRAELDAAVEIYARNADGYLAMEAEVKTLTELLAAEKEARQRAEAKWKTCLDGLRQVNAIADHNIARADAAVADRDRLLAIEREARALVDALDDDGQHGGSMPDVDAAKVRLEAALEAL